MHGNKNSTVEIISFQHASYLSVLTQRQHQNKTGKPGKLLNSKMTTILFKKNPILCGPSMMFCPAISGNLPQRFPAGFQEVSGK